MVRRLSAAATALALAASVAAAQPKIDGFDAAVKEVVAKRFKVGDDTPGVAVAVRQPGVILYKNGFGLANVEKKTRIGPATRFELASLSKPFAGLAVMILQEQGKLSVTDPVSKHIPELPAGNPPVKIADLLQHTSGLPEYEEPWVNPPKGRTHLVNEDFVPALTKARLSFKAGDRHEYTNSNYLLLAVIVARTSKMSYGAFLKQYVLDPAGMANSFVQESPVRPPLHPKHGHACAVGYTFRKKKDFWEPTWGVRPERAETLLVVGDGAVWSSLDDLLAFDDALRAGKLLKPASFKAMLVPSKTRDKQTNPYGFGWVLYFSEIGSLYGYGHDGDWNGFKTTYYRDTERDRTYVVLSNRGRLVTDRVVNVLDPVLNDVLKKK